MSAGLPLPEDCGKPCDPSALFRNSAGQMQRVPVYRLTFASHPVVAFDQRTMSCRYTRRPSSWRMHRYGEDVQSSPHDAARSGIRRMTLAGPKPVSRSSLCRRGDCCRTPVTKRMRSLLITSAGPASPQRLAVYPRAERDNCAGDSREVEKSVGDFWGFWQDFWEGIDLVGKYFLFGRRRVGLTPLCPAGHLPHKEGDRLVVSSRPSRRLRIEWAARVCPISLLVGEMPAGRGG